jgi:hypothetical protein
MTGSFTPQITTVGDNYACNGSIYIYDITGTYDPLCSPTYWMTGWGGLQGINRSDITFASLKIKISGVEIIQSPVNVTDALKNLPATCGTPPTDSTTLLYQITNLYSNYVGGESVEITLEFTTNSSLNYTVVENTTVPIIGGLTPEACLTVSAFDPKIAGEINNLCNTITITDVTGEYNALTNVGGWNDSSTVYKTYALGSPYIISANLEVRYNGVPVFGSPFSVLQTIKNSPNGQYTLFTYNPSSLPNGNYEFILTIIDNNGITVGLTHTVSQTIPVTCSTNPQPPLPPGPGGGGNNPSPQSPTSYFQPSLCVKNDGCKGLIIDDSTGIFDLLNNPYGWNQNVTLWKTDFPTGGQPFVVSALLTIKKNGVIVTGSPFNVLPIIQSSGNSNQYTLMTYTPTVFEDAVYDVTLDLVSSDGSSFTVTVTKTIYCNVTDCVSKLAVALAPDYCTNCESSEFENFQLASTLLNSLDYISRCLGKDEFNKTLTKLKRICSQTPTGGCGCGCD